MHHKSAMFVIGLMVTAIGSGAVAQTTSASTSASTSSAHPNPIATSQQTADQANRKAVEDGNVATVVRTGPSAADRLHSVTSSASDKSSRAKTKVKAKTAASAAADTTSTTNTTAKP